MWKEIRQVVTRLVVLILPFFILLPLYCKCFPMYYLDDEYAMYKQQNDYVTGKQNIEAEAEILIIGDSRTKAGFLPDRLWEGSYNLSLGGATPIEGYYTLKDYLEYHSPPETVIMAYAPMHYMDVDTLWTRSVYFHTLSDENFKELVSYAQQFEDTENILIEDYKTEYLMYRFYMPNKYATALKKSAFVMRHEKTKQKYDIMVEFDGHTYYGTADESGDINGEAKVTDFDDSDIIRAYMGRIIALCRENNIRLIVEQTPMNETSYGILTPEFKEHFRAYMQELAAQNPDVMVYPDFYCYPNTCFGDADHLNKNGVEVFSGHLMSKYSDL